MGFGLVAWVAQGALPCHTFPRGGGLRPRRLRRRGLQAIFPTEICGFWFWCPVPPGPLGLGRSGVPWVLSLLVRWVLSVVVVVSVWCLCQFCFFFVAPVHSGFVP